MSTETTTRFELRKVSSSDWVILDLSLPADHPDRTVACVYEIDDLECDVVWLRDLSLPEHYMSPVEALDDVIRVSVPSSPSPRRPVPIPHLPPVRRADPVPA